PRPGTPKTLRRLPDPRFYVSRRGKPGSPAGSSALLIRDPAAPGLRLWRRPRGRGRVGRGDRHRHDDDRRSAGIAAGRGAGGQDGRAVDGWPEEAVVLLGLALRRLLRAARLGFRSRGLGLRLADPGVALGLLAPGRRLVLALGEQRLVLGGRDPPAFELDVAPGPVRLVLAHPAVAELHVPEALVRGGVLRVEGADR